MYKGEQNWVTVCMYACMQCVLCPCMDYDTEWHRTKAAASGTIRMDVYLRMYVCFHECLRCTVLIHAPYTYITATLLCYIHTFIHTYTRWTLLYVLFVVLVRVRFAPPLKTSWEKERTYDLQMYVCMYVCMYVWQLVKLIISHRVHCVVGILMLFAVIIDVDELISDRPPTIAMVHSLMQSISQSHTSDSSSGSSSTYIHIHTCYPFNWIIISYTYIHTYTIKK